MSTRGDDNLISSLFAFLYEVKSATTTDNVSTEHYVYLCHSLYASLRSNSKTKWPRYQQGFSFEPDPQVFAILEWGPEPPYRIEWHELEGQKRGT